MGKAKKGAGKAARWRGGKDTKFPPLMRSRKPVLRKLFASDANGIEPRPFECSAHASGANLAAEKCCNAPSTTTARRVFCVRIFNCCLYARAPGGTLTPIHPPWFHVQLKYR